MKKLSTAQQRVVDAMRGGESQRLYFATVGVGGRFMLENGHRTRVPRITWRALLALRVIERAHEIWTGGNTSDGVPLWVGNEYRLAPDWEESDV